MEKNDKKFQGKTASEWLALADEEERKEQESFQRCDTDGALSQRCWTINAEKYRQCARLAESDGMGYAETLMDGDRELDAIIVNGRYGSVWLLRDEKDVREFGRKFIPVGENSRVQKDLGLHEGERLFPMKFKFIGDIVSGSYTTVPDYYKDRKAEGR